MELQSAINLAKNLMNQHGVNVPVDINSGKNVLAYVNFKKNIVTNKYDPTLISISRYHIQLNDENEVKETILHEIAHVLRGWEQKHAHDWRWRIIAKQIGCSGNRTADEKITNFVQGRFQAKCPTCGKVYHRHRITKKLLHANWRCIPCRTPIKFVGVNSDTNMLLPVMP